MVKREAKITPKIPANPSLVLSSISCPPRYIIKGTLPRTY
jgi:hypothetical protein